MTLPPPQLPPRITQAATTIAGQPVVVSCIGNLGLDGLTVDEYIMLSNPVCRNLVRFLHGGRDGDAASAVLALTHEAEHAAGVTDETNAECAAVRDVPRMVRLLGALVSRDLRRTLTLADGLIRGNPGYSKHPCRAR